MTWWYQYDRCLCGDLAKSHYPNLEEDYGPCLDCGLCDGFRFGNPFDCTPVDSAFSVIEPPAKRFILNPNALSDELKRVELQLEDVMLEAETVILLGSAYSHGRVNYQWWESDDAVTYELCSWANCTSAALEVAPCGRCNRILCLRHKGENGCYEWALRGVHQPNNDHYA